MFSLLGVNFFFLVICIFSSGYICNMNERLTNKRKCNV